jgi:hypothetical protein
LPAAVKGICRDFVRIYSGLFRKQSLEFPGKSCPASDDDMSTYGLLVKPSDVLADKVVANGTEYSAGNIVVMEVFSSDVIRVGVILRVVLRRGQLFFLVSLHEAARNRFGFFDSLPCNQVTVVNADLLADYKPLVKRGDYLCFPFILHHHLPTPLDVKEPS